MMWATYLLVALAAFAGGYLTGWGTGTPLCTICRQPLPRVHQDGRCGGTPGLGRGDVGHG